MSLPARLFADQRGATRQVLGTDATLRDTGRSPYDVRIGEISSTGCHIATLLELPIGALVTIGIPEIGIHEARLVRETDGGYGCAFTRALTSNELGAAMAAQQGERIAVANFPRHHLQPETPRLTPPGLIGAVIIGAVAISWVTVAVILHAAGVI